MTRILAFLRSLPRPKPAGDRFRCRLRTVVETVAMPEFWRSLIQPPLVVMSGHVWSEAKWSEPAELAGELVEYDDSACVECGYRETPRPWRRYFGSHTDPLEPDPYTTGLLGGRR